VVVAEQNPPADPRDAIRQRAQALGFDAVGFAAASLGEEVREHLTVSLAEGRHGDMAWMAETAGRRGDPRALWPEARSVIALGMSYAPSRVAGPAAGHRDRAVIATYARGRDYHDVIKGRLKVLAQWLHRRFACQVKVFVDTAPVMEKPLAAAAGLGWQGKHTNLVSRRHGSWLFLGEIFTDLELASPDSPENNPPPEDNHCGRCRRCQDACPTDALREPWRLDTRRCIAYLTIEHKGPIPEELRPLMGNRVYGCDDCLVVCPWNRFARASREAAFLPRAELTAPRLADLVQLDDATFRQVLSGSPVKRIGRDRFVRNVLIALGNCADQRYVAAIRPLLGDPSPLVVDAARWAFDRLTSGTIRDAARGLIGNDP
jgi:epoxyqueuosine reductase